MEKKKKKKREKSFLWWQNNKFSDFELLMMITANILATRSQGRVEA